MIKEGQVRPVVEQVYTWDTLTGAHRRVETGKVTGKVTGEVAVIAPADRERAGER
jgi:NADPH:quinone reductase-like Zn-dependent oxidoreductase